MRRITILIAFLGMLSLTGYAQYKLDVQGSVGPNNTYRILFLATNRPAVDFTLNTGNTTQSCSAPTTGIVTMIRDALLLQGWDVSISGCALIIDEAVFGVTVDPNGTPCEVLTSSTGCDFGANPGATITYTTGTTPGTTTPVFPGWAAILVVATMGVVGAWMSSKKKPAQDMKY